jgi:hypothetical protein
MTREGSQPEYRTTSAEEERLSPAVQRFKEALGMRAREEDLGARKANLTKQSEKLRGVLDLRQALMLHEWRDNDFDKTVAEVDGKIREELGNRLIQTLREELKSADTSRQLAAADFLGEIGNSIRGTGAGPEARRGLAAALAPDLADLLRGKNEVIDAAAARALGKIHPDPKVAIPALERALQSGQVLEQRAAAEALAA